MSRPPTLNVPKYLYDISGEGAFAYLARAKELARKGMDIVSFGIGQPDFPTPKHIREAAKKALDEGFTGYTETAGILELREAIAEYLNNRYNADVKVDEIVVTTGAKTAILLALALYVREGVEVVIPEPSYPAYAQVVKLFKGKPVYVPLKWEGGSKGFSLDLGLIEESITGRTRIIVLNNPHNPTGAVFTPKQVDELLDLARRRNLIIVVDEIYDNFVYDSAFKSVLSHSDWRDNVVYVNGFSKTFAMTGWRLGYIVVRKEIVDRVIDLAVNVYSCAASFAQKAGVEALRGDWKPIKEMIEVFRKRRDMLYELLKQIPGFDVWRSPGTFYMFPSIAGALELTGLGSSKEFADTLLEKYGVVVLPGTAFPDKAGEGFIRFSFAASFDDIRKGAERIKKAVEELSVK